MCVCNVFYSNLPSYIMDDHNVICPKETCNLASESEIHVLLIGIEYSRQILEQWKFCTSPLDKACVNHNPLDVDIVLALNEFVHLDPVTNNLNKYSTTS